VGSLKQHVPAKTTNVSYKDARNALKLKKAEKHGDQNLSELIIDEDDDVFNRLSFRSRAMTTRGKSRPNSQLLE